MTLSISRQKNDLLLLASLVLLELSTAVVPMAIYMKGDRPFAVFISSRPGILFLLAVATIVVTGAVLVHQFLAHKRSPSGHFPMIVTVNLVTVILIVVTGEVALRAVSRSSVEGETVGGVVLKPKNWDTFVQHYRQLNNRAGGDFSYLVYDDLMGWTVGPNRRSANGLYRSSVEGIRASEEGVSFARSEGGTRIALIGDSHTFGEDVKYEETWGYFLEKELGPEFQVLNFGVSGYGLDQMFLRYEKDIRRWKPRIVIFGFTSHDTERTMFVYPFISFPEWDMPFSKSRFILRDGELANINAPAPAPEAIFSRASIVNLSALEYHRGYTQSDWERRFYHLSYLARLFVSWVPRWTIEHSDVSEKALVTVNASILKAFTRSTMEAGAIPLIIYFPNKEELEKGNSPVTNGKRALQEAGIAYTDLTSCLLPLNAADLYVPAHRHYSSQGNAVVANCLHKVVNEALARSHEPKPAAVHTHR